MALSPDRRYLLMPSCEELRMIDLVRQTLVVGLDTGVRWLDATDRHARRVATRHRPGQRSRRDRCPRGHRTMAAPDRARRSESITLNSPEWTVVDHPQWKSLRR
jgi:hypothetical protein